MFARMIHDTDGKLRSLPYGTQKQCINSVNRKLLNELLLNKAESFSNIDVYFNYKFVSADFSTGKVIMIE